MDEKCNCTAQQASGLDIKTPRNEQLTAFYKRSFAHFTVKERLPVILTRTIDSLVRNKEEISATYGNEALEELKTVIGELSKLKYEIQTNKPIQELSSTHADGAIYDKYLKEKLDSLVTCTYFNTIWLHAECYMYRRIYEIFFKTNNLKEYDPFRTMKEQSYNSHKPLIEGLGRTFTDLLSRSPSEGGDYDNFKLLLKVNLWGNKCDLSLSGGLVNVNTSNVMDMINSFDENVLCDHTDLIWTAANQSSRYQKIDIVLDNGGYELFTDLCLADFLITRGLCEKVRFYVKMMPWFISDVTKYDFQWTLQMLDESNDPNLMELSSKWSTYLKTQQFSIVENGFWTLPLEFKHMWSVDEDLYRKLAKAKLVIFKGDLNYRKLFGERNWDPTTSVEEALEGFHPTRLCTLRTLKADIICGLDEGVETAMESKDSSWLISGNYGVIQFCGKVTKTL